MSETVGTSASESENKKDDIMDDENALLQQNLAISMDDPAATVTPRDTDMSEAGAVDQDLALALQLSVQEGAKDGSGQADMGKLLADQSFVSSIVASLPGVEVPQKFPVIPSKSSGLISTMNPDTKGEKDDLFVKDIEDTDDADDMDDDDADMAEESAFENILRDMIPGAKVLKVKVLNVTTPGKINRDLISKVVEQMEEEEEEEEHEEEDEELEDINGGDEVKGINEE
ncbi:hypothetical protein L2E82_25660 [Cichorium intybus]|uniref:Uncharacterized protein n=1 Tax=Cichorium intybus TaxID=13427 RepID=A0ACB9E457_CICIN|nr:hypothetical protein L2E82_25660 [Cichorium intybus]